MGGFSVPVCSTNGETFVCGVNVQLTMTNPITIRIRFTIVNFEVLLLFVIIYIDISLESFSFNPPYPLAMTIEFDTFVPLTFIALFAKVVFFCGTLMESFKKMQKQVLSFAKQARWGIDCVKIIGHSHVTLHSASSSTILIYFYIHS
jgi:hypothetical protein